MKKIVHTIRKDHLEQEIRLWNLIASLDLSKQHGTYGEGF